MSLIKDVKEELFALELSRKRLRQFALLIGLILLVLALWIHTRKNAISIAIILYGGGGFFIISGLLRPFLLNGVYRIWMGIAFVIGWFVSRILLVLIYYLILSPIALAARVFGKRMLDIDYTNKKESYWIQLDQTKIKDYRKMY